MRPSIPSARHRVRGPWFVLFAFLSSGLTGTASGFDSNPLPFAQVSLHDVTHEVDYWPAHCAQMEIDRSILEASRCWWSAADEIARHARDGRALADDVEKLRVQWLWRGMRLSLRSPAPGRPAHPVAELEPQHFKGPHPARVAGSPECASILSSDREKCLGTVAAAPPVQNAASRPKKKMAVAAAKRKKLATVPKPDTSPAQTRIRKKKGIFEPVAMRAEQAALPLVPKVQTGSNFVPRWKGKKSKNTAEITDWYR